MKIFEQELVRKKDTVSGMVFVTPNPEYLDNVQIMYTILNLIWEDWEILTIKYRDEIKNRSANEVAIIFADYYINNQEKYLKCLFSYVYFFWALVNVYEQVFANMNQFNKNNNLKVKHPRKPFVDKYIQKTRHIRDLSITHIGSKRVDPINSLAAHAWRPLSASYRKDTIPDLEDIEFGSGKFSGMDNEGRRIEQSMDFRVKGLLETKKRCQQHLEHYDFACVQYLSLLRKAISDG